MKSLSAIQDMNGIEAFELGESTDIYLSGRCVGVADFGDALTTIVGAGDQLNLIAFTSGKSFSIDEIGINVTDVPLLSTNYIKFVIYEASQDNAPSSKVYESAALTVDAAGYISTAVSFNFNKSRRYWIGIRHTGGIRVRAIPVGGIPSLGYNSATATTSSTVLRRSIDFNTAAPTTWVIQATDFISSAMADIRMRLA